MASFAKYKTIDAAQLRALVFFFAALLALGSGAAFAQQRQAAQGKVDAIQQFHALSSDGALLGGNPGPAANQPLASQVQGNGAFTAPVVIPDGFAQFIIPGRQTTAAAPFSKVKRFVLYSCQRLAEPPPFL